MIVDYQLVPCMGIYVSPQHLYISMAFIYLPRYLYISLSIYIYLPQYLYISLDIYINPWVGYLYISMAFIYLPRYLYISLSIYISPSVFTGHLYKSMGIYILLLVFTNTHFYQIMRHVAPHIIIIIIIALQHNIQCMNGVRSEEDNVVMCSY